MTLNAAGRVVLAFASRVIAMVAGFTKNFTTNESLTVSGVSMTQPQILAKLAEVAALEQNITKARTAYQTAVAAKRAAQHDAAAFMTNLDRALEQHYGRLSPVLPEFGIAPPKPRKVRTPQDKVVSQAHGKATRELHGIMGPKQREAITLEGKSGLILVDPQGKPVAGALTGPTPPGSGTPVEASIPSATPAAETTTPSGGTPTGK